MGARTKIKNRLKKVMGTSDILVVAFGAMIGWGWVVSSGASGRESRPYGSGSHVECTYFLLQPVENSVLLII